MTKRKQNSPVEIGARYRLRWRVEPFYSDEVLVVHEVIREGRGKSDTRLARCQSSRGAQGLVDCSALAPWALGDALIQYVKENPGCTEHDVREAFRDGCATYDMVTALVILREEIVRRGPYGNLYVRGEEPPCPHTHVRDVSRQYVDPTECCLNCGATRKHSSTTWSDGSKS